MMKHHALSLLSALLLATPGLALAADQMKGQIVSHTGQTLVSRNNGADATILLNDATKIRGTTGAGQNVSNSLSGTEDVRSPSWQRHVVRLGGTYNAPGD